jgi:AraC-like DNA-binding protein
MRFDTYIPCDVLKAYIKSFAIHESENEQSYKVLPDTGLVIGFQFKGNLGYVENNKNIPLSISGITGLRDSFRVFQPSKNIGTVLVVFREGGAANFFKQPLHELFRESISLDNFILRSELLLIEEQLLEASTDSQRIQVVEKFFISQLTPIPQDKLVITALSMIHQAKGNIRVNELAERLNISISPLEKRFRKIVGASPKKFASIVRMKNTIQRYASVNSFTALEYELGFYDQAHFIKEFKTFTGVTPEKYSLPDL